METKNIIVGARYGLLTVVSGPYRSDDHHVLYGCKCDCGNFQKVRRGKLRNGVTICCQSCAIKRNPRYHGKSQGEKNRLYNLWRNIKTRCNNPNRDQYHRYGGRGIRVCSEWENSFLAFEGWAIIQHGFDIPLYQIDRINNDGDYSPENCRFVSSSVNNRNRNLVKAFGEAKCLIAWSEDARCSVGRKAIYNRLKNGWDAEKAIITPRQKG